jgi:hypothetical protein
MPFDPKTARNAGKNLKEVLQKKEVSTIKQKMELLWDTSTSLPLIIS